MEIYGGGSYRKKRPTKAQIKAMKEGHIKADAIRSKRETEHKVEEIPEAEALLEAHLEHWDTVQKKKNPVEQPLEVQEPNTSWWEHLLVFFRK